MHLLNNFLIKETVMAKFTPTDIDRLVGKRIQQKRKELGLTAEKLSECVNISQPQFSRYERGTNKINLFHLVEIAIFLKTPISYFFIDCIGEFEWNNDELDRYWQELNHTQKVHFVEFLKSLDKTN